MAHFASCAYHWIGKVQVVEQMQRLLQIDEADAPGRGIAAKGVAEFVRACDFAEDLSRCVMEKRHGHGTGL